MPERVIVKYIFGDYDVLNPAWYRCFEDLALIHWSVLAKNKWRKPIIRQSRFSVVVTAPVLGHCALSLEGNTLLYNGFPRSLCKICLTRKTAQSYNRSRSLDIRA